MEYPKENVNQEKGRIYSDTGLEQVVMELLQTSKKLDASQISVMALNGDITLSGTVKDEEQKNAAGSIAQLIHGVGHIRNDITIKSNEQSLH